MTAVVSAREALIDLHRARRRTRTKQIDVFEALYRVYVTAIVGGIALWVVSGLTGDHRVDAATAAQVRDHGAQVIGAVIGLAWAIGLRSGGRGGPLVIEAADVRHVLLAPIDRTLVLRPMALRQIRFGVFAGLAAGAVGGLLAYRRLPGPALEWVGYGAITGALAVAGALGLAMAVSGARLGRLAGGGAAGGGLARSSLVGGLLALGVAGWSAADAATGSTTSPATWLGRLAISPLGWRSGSLIGAGVAIAAVGAGLWWIGGCSIEAAERRASLVGQIRFAATLRDIRTVVVLRRQLSQELPRQRRPRRSRLSGLPDWLAWPVWRRGWQGIIRFPPLRVLRLAALGAAAGLAAVGAWRGTTPLIVVAGLALYLAALDAVEPLAQELDHPDRRDGYPVDVGPLYLRLVAPSLVVMIAVAAVGVAVAVAASGFRAVAWQVGAVVVLPAAGCALGGAVTSVIQGPPPIASATDSMLPPEVAGARAMIRTVWPPLLATIGVAPVLAGRHPSVSEPAVIRVAGVTVPVLALVIIVGIWIRQREPIHAWFRVAMKEATSGPARPAAR
jgi:hypothetical protein